MLAGRSPFDIVTATDNPDQNTEDYLFQVILEKPIRIPRSLSVKASSCLKGFLNKNPLDRLGCRTGAEGQSSFQVLDVYFTCLWPSLLRRREEILCFHAPIAGLSKQQRLSPRCSNSHVLGWCEGLFGVFSLINLRLLTHLNMCSLSGTFCLSREISIRKQQNMAWK